MKALFVVCISVFCLWRYALSLGANNVIEDNDLGLATRSCSSSYCNSKDSLELWLAIEFQCVGQYVEEPLTPSYAAKYPATVQRIEIEDYAQAIPFITRHLFGIMCSIVALVGLWIGYFLGRFLSGKKMSIIYSPVSTSEDTVTFSREKDISFSRDFS